MAVNLYGVPRFTKDLDIIVDMERNNLLKLIRVLTGLGYKPKVPVNPEEFVDAKNRKRWEKEKGMIVFSFWNKHTPYEAVDIMTNSIVDFNRAKQHKVYVKAVDIRIPVIGIDDLIKTKKATGREHDKSDIESLMKVKAIKK